MLVYARSSCQRQKWVMGLVARHQGSKVISKGWASQILRLLAQEDALGFVLKTVKSRCNLAISWILLEMLTAQNSTKFIEQVSRNAWCKRIESLWVLIVELICLLSNVVALSLPKVAHLGWYLRQASLIGKICVVVLVIAIIHHMSPLPVFVARSLVTNVRHAWLQGRDAISCKSISANLRLVLVKLELILKKALVVMVTKRETRTRAGWWNLELVNDFFPQLIVADALRPAS